MSFPVQRRRAFTLVELLTALTITAVLAGIAIVVGQRVHVNASNSRIICDIYELTQGLEAFSRQLGDYPPDFHDAKVTEAFLRQAFPKCRPENYPDLSSQNPATALYFWLAGPKGKGLSANPANPFDDGPRRIGPFCRFNPLQVREVDGTKRYFPLCNLRGAPYVYFRGGNQGYDGHPGFAPARPYRCSRDLSWINADSYQILCAGQDGKYGKGCHYPGGDDYDLANHDDITNFSGGPLLPTTWARQTRPTPASPTGGPKPKAKKPAQRRAPPVPPVPGPPPPGDQPRFELIILPDKK
jgi:prepilin-type N-terminal cleavage/methylation domain-containing protein